MKVVYDNIIALSHQVKTLDFLKLFNLTISVESESYSRVSGNPWLDFWKARLLEICEFCHILRFMQPLEYFPAIPFNIFWKPFKYFRVTLWIFFSNPLNVSANSLNIFRQPLLICSGNLVNIFVQPFKYYHATVLIFICTDMKFLK